jgi:putative transposase
MKRSRYTAPEMANIIEKYKAGSTVAELCREHHISVSTFYAWKLKLGFSGATEIHPMQRLKKENRRLRQLIAAMNSETDRLKGVIRRSRVSRDQQ